MMPENLLLLRIAVAKDRLVDLAHKYGRNDPRVVRYSQKLDKLILEVMRRRLAG